MSEPEAAETAPRKKKKRRKKKRTAEAAPPKAPPAAAKGGTERPPFLLSFPAHPELDRLVRAFEAGDYRTVREHAPELAESAEDPRVRDAALELWRRIEPDPLIRYLLFASIGLLAFLIFYFYSHRH